MPPLIRVEGVAVGYDGRAILEDISFEVARGEIFLILGPSGCGKTTLMKALVGLLAPLAGRVHIEGLGAPHRHAGAPRFGVMFQSGALFGSLTLLENVALPLRSWTELPEDALLSVAQSRLALVGLSGFENHLPGEISGGMKKRAGIARALALDSELLFLDEPGAGLDPISAAGLDDLVLSLQEHLQRTMVVVTHELHSIRRLDGRCILLDKDVRGVRAAGRPSELLSSADPVVSAFFNRRALETVP